jgi:hypothetical protein
MSYGLKRAFVMIVGGLGFLFSVPKQVRGACTSTYQLAITLGSELSVAW